MNKTTRLVTEAIWQSKPVVSSWGSQPSPIRRARAYLTVPLSDTTGLPELLFCDPLTGLVAYPSFEVYMIAVLPRLATSGLHFAISDVDDLTGYVTAAKAYDRTLFGHLAGSDSERTFRSFGPFVYWSGYWSFKPVRAVQFRYGPLTSGVV